MTVTPICLLDEGVLGSEFSLPEMRILWEVAQSDQVSASWLEAELGLHASKLSRTLRRFREAGLVAFAADARDARIKRLSLTERGRRKFDPLDRRSGARRPKAPSRAFAIRAPGISAGSSSVTARSIPGNTGSTRHSRGWSPKSSGDM